MLRESFPQARGCSRERRWSRIRSWAAEDVATSEGRVAESDIQSRWERVCRKAVDPSHFAHVDHSKCLG